jgi:hypothetical protein
MYKNDKRERYSDIQSSVFNMGFYERKKWFESNHSTIAEKWGRLSVERTRCDGILKLFRWLNNLEQVKDLRHTILETIRSLGIIRDNFD